MFHLQEPGRTVQQMTTCLPLTLLLRVCGREFPSVRVRECLCLSACVCGSGAASRARGERAFVCMCMFVYGLQNEREIVRERSSKTPAWRRVQRYKKTARHNSYAAGSAVNNNNTIGARRTRARERETRRER